MKVLIISHNPITTYQNMGKTMLSLFSSFKKEELCQLYIYPTVPDVDVCESYFRITDRNILNSYLHFGRVDSKKIESWQINANDHSFYESKDDENFLKKNKNPLSIIARDMMWQFSNWYDNKLDDWLKEQKPDRIFIAPGEAKFIYDIALKIAKRYSLPIVTYVCDEFYFVKPSKAFCGKIQLKLLESKIQKLMSASSHLITICDELSKAYSKEFSVSTTTIYTGTNYPVNGNPQIKENISGITYLGNLAYNRLNSLLDVGKALQTINAEMHTNYKLFLYTRNLSEEEKEIIDTIETIKYCGYVTGSEYDKVLHSADILLHIEAFDVTSVDRVKNSISTKIADCLGSGVPLFAYGPKGIASINYLKNNNCAFVADNRSSLDIELRKIFFDENLKVMILENAKMVAEKNHDAMGNSRILYSIFLSDNMHHKKSNKIERY